MALFSFFNLINNSKNSFGLFAKLNLQDTIIPKIPSLPIIKSIKSISSFNAEYGPLAFLIFGLLYFGIGTLIILLEHLILKKPILKVLINYLNY